MTIAYFSMEIGLESGVRTYSGGLGILAGDFVRTAADQAVPMVAVTLLYRAGHFRQHLDAVGNQTESPDTWEPANFMTPLPTRVVVQIEGRNVQVGVWLYRAEGISGASVPVYFLDTDLPENDPSDRALTGELYGGDARYRFCQETLLGLGGIAALRALGHVDIDVYHMNEGHAALLGLALLEETAGLDRASRDNINRVAAHCAFTTHTPVPAGHDRFSFDLASRVLGPERSAALGVILDWPQELNLTQLALRFSRYVNGVSLRHEQITAAMFPGVKVESVTNGVHVGNWTSPSFQALYGHRIPAWRRDNTYLRLALGLTLAEVEEAHESAKLSLTREVERRTSVVLDPSHFTIGLARRATAYKRLDLMFGEPGRLRRLAREVGPVQVVCAGKAHPRDEAGKQVIRNIFAISEQLRGEVPIVYLEGYDIDLGAQMVAGVDLWVNTPESPMEASGTSGMKAALNGVPSLSTLDGWWLEGHIEGVTGWAIDEGPGHSAIDSLYGKLEYEVMPAFYRRREEFLKVMRLAIAVNGSFFNSQRMLDQYVRGAYLDGGVLHAAPVASASTP